MSLEKLSASSFRPEHNFATDYRHLFSQAMYLDEIACRHPLPSINIVDGKPYLLD